MSKEPKVDPYGVPIKHPEWLDHMPMVSLCESFSVEKRVCENGEPLSYEVVADRLNTLSAERKAFLQAYHKAMDDLKEIKELIHDNPPDLAKITLGKIQAVLNRKPKGQ